MQADDATRAWLSSELSEVLTERLNAACDFHGNVQALVDELRALGHDLWSFDESHEFEAWCPNWVKRTGPGIIVTFKISVEVEWPDHKES